MPDHLLTLFDRGAVSLTEKAYGTLEESIVMGVLPPGSQWSEVALSEKIGLGRTPTREALQRLSYEGLVRIAPRQGVFITEIDYQGQLKIIQARRQIEQLVMAEAAACASDAEREAMQQVAVKLEALKTEKDIRGYLRLHFTQTRLLGEASRNAYAAKFYSVLQTLARRFMVLHLDGYADFPTLCDLHIRQIDAVIAGDKAAAVASAIERNDYADTFARKILMELIDKSGVTIQVGRPKR